MARSSPWSVKGVDQGARQIAREAAKQHGLTIGAWVDRAIKKRAESLNAETPLETTTTLDAAPALPIVPKGVQEKAPAAPYNPAPKKLDETSFDVEQALKSARGQINENDHEEKLESDIGGRPAQADPETIIVKKISERACQRWYRNL